MNIDASTVHPDPSSASPQRDAERSLSFRPETTADDMVVGAIKERHFLANRSRGGGLLKVRSALPERHRLADRYPRLLKVEVRYGN